MGNNDSHWRFESESNSTEIIKPDILIPSNQNESQEFLEAMDVTIVKDDQSCVEQDWFDLARKLRGQNRELLDTIVKLEQALATSRQQLQDYQKRSRHHNTLLSQLQTTQAENNSLIEQIKESQHYEQQKQEELKIIQQEINTLRESVLQLQQECSVLKEENVDKNTQISLQEKHISELQQRLQRQQRYSLQYKAALDQCLSNSAKKIPSQNSTENTMVKPDAASSLVTIQPWSSPTSVQPSEEQEKEKVDSDAIDPTLEALFSLSPVETNVSIPKNQDTHPKKTEQESINKENQDISDSKDNSAHALLMSSSVPFSFSIDRHRKEDAAREKVDLPSFLRRQ